MYLLTFTAHLDVPSPVLSVCMHDLTEFSENFSQLGLYYPNFIE